MTIVAAACKYGDVICFIPAPARHSDVEQSLFKAFGKYSARVKREQGFIDDQGRYLNRRDAYIHARACDQPWFRPEGSEYYRGPDLYSEDVWESGDKFISPLTEVKRCCACGTKENLHSDGWYGYRCDSDDCLPF